jgi:hypothetical protein
MGEEVMTSARLLLVLFVGTVVGALTGLVVGGGFGLTYLAILAGFLGCLTAVIVRNLVGLGPDDTKTPWVLTIYAIIASLAGSLAAKEVADFSQITAPGGIGGLAGLFAAMLLAMLLITYHTKPGDSPKLHKKR